MRLNSVNHRVSMQRAPASNDQVRVCGLPFVIFIRLKVHLKLCTRNELATKLKYLSNCEMCRCNPILCLMCSTTYCMFPNIGPSHVGPLYTKPHDPHYSCVKLFAQDVSMGHGSGTAACHINTHPPPRNMLDFSLPTHHV